jgi:L-ribulose-5-phosphate 3-epimerase
MPLGALVTIGATALLLWGYSTNGWVDHRLGDAFHLLKSLGYSAVAITLGPHGLDPFDRGFCRRVEEVKRELAYYGLRVTVETGGRYVLDPWRKHWPTLLEPLESWRRRRLEFLKTALKVAAYWGADAVSFWSGALPRGLEELAAWRLLEEGCRELLEHARASRVRLGLEPEPGMFVERMEHFARLKEKLPDSWLGLTLDIGHVHCLDDGNPSDVIRQWSTMLYCVHLEDMIRGRHEHLLFGAGEIDFPPVLETLIRVGYRFGAYVELAGHSAQAPQTAEAALRFLLHAARF